MLRKHAPLISWRTIKQTITRPALTLYALKRQSKYFLKLLSLGVLVLLLIITIYCLKSCTQTRHPLTALRTPIKSIQFTTNGTLSKDWILKQSDLNQAVDIMDLDIFKLKLALEKIPQVKEALIERAFPSTIKVFLVEYIPIARIAVHKSSDSTPQVIYVSKEGTVFESMHYPPFTVKTLPFLTDIHLKKTLAGFEPIVGMDIVSDLLEKTAKYKPHLYAQFKLISLKKFDPTSHNPWSIIKILTYSQQEWLFATHLFMGQLERLDYVLRTLDTTDKQTIRRIDLSLIEDAVVEFQTDKPFKKHSL